MENTEQNQVTPEDAEITALQARLEDARKKKAALLDAQQAKALSDAQAVRLREQERSCPSPKYYPA
jgi:hypothetical protein